jgi:hypothetical protein
VALIVSGITSNDVIWVWAISVGLSLGLAIGSAYERRSKQAGQQVEPKATPLDGVGAAVTTKSTFLDDESLQIGAYVSSYDYCPMCVVI